MHSSLQKQSLLFFFAFLLCKLVFAQNEQFTMRQVRCNLSQPWEVTYGQDNQLWVTESRSYKVAQIDPNTGNRVEILDLSAKKNFSREQYPFPQGGLMGLALHPQLLAGKPYVYLAYVYQFNGCGTNNTNCQFKTKVVRYTYDAIAKKLNNEQIICDTIPGSDDHNGGRMTIGNINGTPFLFYAVGDMGAGQFANATRKHNGQNPAVYEGKILRFNVEPDADAGLAAWIPNNNPFNNAVWSLGHRNPQGLVMGANGILYETEHGPYSDDELNMIISGKNYGFPYTVGLAADGNYNGLKVGTGATVPLIQSEAVYATNMGTSYQEPLKTFFPASNASISTIYNNVKNNTEPFANYFMSWPSIAPSGTDYYASNTIPNWNNSILVASLKQAKMYRLKLNADGRTLSSDTIAYFSGKGRFRDVAISADGSKIYMACDSTGVTSGPTAGTTLSPQNKGCILEFQYQPTITPTSPDLTLANLHTTQTEITQGQVLNFNFDLKNIGIAAASANFNIKSYLSKDQTLSDDDYFDGTIPTGNIAAGQTIAAIPGAMTVRNTLAIGTYYLILKVDADNQISESNEGNNTLVSASTINVKADVANTVKLEVIAVSGPTSVKPGTSITLNITIKNTGNIASYYGQDSVTIYQRFSGICTKICPDGIIKVSKNKVPTPAINANEIKIISATFDIPSNFTKDKRFYYTPYDGSNNYYKETYISFKDATIWDLNTPKMYQYDINPILPIADIQVSASAEQNTYTTDGNVKFKIAVKNNSTETANLISIPIPINIPVTYQQYQAFSYIPSKGTVNYNIIDGRYVQGWNIQTLNPNETAYLDADYKLLSESWFNYPDTLKITPFHSSKVIDNNSTNDATLLKFFKPNNNSNISITLTAIPTTYKQWNYNQITVTVENKGTTAANFTAKINLDNAQAVIAAEKPISATNGNLDTWNKIWNIGSLAAGAKATLSFYVFTKVASGDIKIDANLTAPTTATASISLTNGTGGTTQQPDLTLANLHTTQTEITQGQVLNFNFDLKNIGTATVSANFSIKSYLSKDQTLSNDDYFDGTIPTGNIAAGQNIAAIPGAMTVRNTLAAGSYYLILKVDADNQISESNEGNNTMISASTINVKAVSTTPLCGVEIGTGELLCVNQLADFSNELYLDNQGKTQKITIDKNGNILSSVPYVAPVQDSILVKNNTVIKKLANGTIAFQKPITQSVLSRFPNIKITHSAQMSDGNFAIVGEMLNERVNTFTDSLLLIKADNNLNFISFVRVKNNTIYGNTLPVVSHQNCVDFRLLNDNTLFLVQRSEISSSYYGWFGDFYKFDNNFNILKRVSSKSLLDPSLNNNYIVSPCGTIKAIGKGSYASTKSGSREEKILILNPITFRLSEKEVSSSDGYGNISEYLSYYNTFNQDSLLVFGRRLGTGIDPLTANYTTSEMFINKTKVGNYVNFVDIAKIGLNAYAYITTSNGKVFINNPSCSTTPTTSQAITLTATPTTYKQWNYNQITVTVENKGTTAANFTAKINLDNNQAVIAAEKSISATNGNLDTWNKIWNIGSLAAGAKATLSFYIFTKVASGDIKIDANLTAPTAATASITLTPSGTTPPPTGGTDIQVTLASDKTALKQWDFQTFTLTAKNIGTQTGENIVINANIPTKTVVATETQYKPVASIGSFTQASNAFNWTIPSLAAGQTATFKYTLFTLDVAAPMSFTAMMTSLKQTDANSTNNQSSVNFSTLSRSEQDWTAEPIRLYPTLSSNEVTLEFFSHSDKDATILIANSLGAISFKQDTHFNQGNNIQQLDITALPTGMYFVILLDKNGKSKPVKFIKMSE